jgi:hypothetical protein
MDLFGHNNDNNEIAKIIRKIDQPGKEFLRSAEGGYVCPSLLLLRMRPGQDKIYIPVQY